MSEQNCVSEMAFNIVLKAVETEMSDLHSYLFHEIGTDKQAEEAKAELAELEGAQETIEKLRETLRERLGLTD